MVKQAVQQGRLPGGRRAASEEARRTLCRPLSFRATRACRRRTLSTSWYARPGTSEDLQVGLVATVVATAALALIWPLAFRRGFRKRLTAVESRHGTRIRSPTDPAPGVAVGRAGHGHPPGSRQGAPRSSASSPGPAASRACCSATPYR